MTVSIICFTARGGRLAAEIGRRLKGHTVHLYGKGSWEIPPDLSGIDGSLQDWTGKQFEEDRAILFIGATGIAVRAIAPFVKDKLRDVPVMAADERGEFVISLLSGHVGGANELTLELADCIGARPVITTATDVEGKFAADVFAVQNGLVIENREGIAWVSARLLRGERISLLLEEWEPEPYRQEELPEGLKLLPPGAGEADMVISSKEEERAKGRLRLRPRTLVLGMGCRRGKAYEELERFASSMLECAGKSWEDVYALASIDIKAGEQGLIELARRKRILFLTFSAEELENVSGNLHSSDFVQERVGVDNVCERSALLAAGAGGELVLPRQSESGMTLALARGRRRIDFGKS